MTTATRFKRATLIVADLERAFAIYRDILGFSVDYIEGPKTESYSVPVFGLPPGATLRFATLSALPDQVRTLALTEVTGVPTPKPAQAPWAACMVLNCPELDRVLEALRARDDIRFVPEERLVTPDGTTGREVAFVDPDGHLVVLYKLD